MGQQQLLLIVLGVIIVGVAVVLGITYFRQYAADSKREILTDELVNMASMAQQHYRKPSAMGGGNRSFNGSNGGQVWSIPDEIVTSAAGYFKITEIQSDSLKILATGNEVVTGNDSVMVSITIGANDYRVNIIN
ncbi:MAG: hypothetical protein PVH88_12130 [Ignavibacteria bacterium]|jgi:hypothetical protein